MQIALVSRNLAPFPGGGGIGEYVDTIARVLAPLGAVTIFTSDLHRDAYDALRSAGDPDGRLVPEADYVFLPEPTSAGGYYNALHRYSALVLEAITEHYPRGGPDFIEVSDYLGEGFVLAQAVATRDPRLARSQLAVRLHTTAEICAVLDGHSDFTDFDAAITCDMERYALRHADVLLWPGGDVLGLYERYYGSDWLAPAALIRNPLLLDSTVPSDSLPIDSDGPLRFLYLGRLERRKGVQNLLRAVTAVADPNWRLTLLGADTVSGPLGGSLRGQLELMAADDPRIEFLNHVPRTTAWNGYLSARHRRAAVPLGMLALRRPGGDAAQPSRPRHAHRRVHRAHPARNQWLANSRTSPWSRSWSRSSTCCSTALRR